MGAGRRAGEKHGEKQTRETPRELRPKLPPSRGSSQNALAGTPVAKRPCERPASGVGPKPGPVATAAGDPKASRCSSLAGSARPLAGPGRSATQNRCRPFVDCRIAPASDGNVNGGHPGVKPRGTLVFAPQPMFSRGPASAGRAPGSPSGAGSRGGGTAPARPFRYPANAPPRRPRRRPGGIPREGGEEKSLLQRIPLRAGVGWPGAGRDPAPLPRKSRDSARRPGKAETPRKPWLSPQPPRGPETFLPAHSL